jgi:hypothetical protein
MEFTSRDTKAAKEPLELFSSKDPSPSFSLLPSGADKGSTKSGASSARMPPKVRAVQIVGPILGSISELLHTRQRPQKSRGMGWSVA